MLHHSTGRRIVATAAALTLGIAAAVVSGPAAAATAPKITHYSGSLADGGSWIADVPAR